MALVRWWLIHQNFSETVSLSLFFDVCFFVLFLNESCLIVLKYLISHLEFFIFFCYKMKLFGAIVIHRHLSHIILVYWYRILMNRRHFEWHSVHNIFSAPSSCSVFIHIQFYISQNINSFFLIHENLEREKASVSPQCLLICFFFYFYNWKTSTQQL